MPREKSLQKYITQYVNEQAASIVHVYHGSRFSVKGYPDIHGVTRGLPVWWETKTPSGSLSESQRVLHNELRKAGGLVFVCNSISEFHAQWEYVQRVDLSPRVSEPRAFTYKGAE